MTPDQIVNAVSLILDFACLLLWLNWRSAAMPEPALAPGRTLAATLRRAETPRSSRWNSLGALGAVLAARSFFYWQIGPTLNWTAMLDAKVVAIPFYSGFLDRMFLFSLLSFLRMLLLAHVWLLLLSVLNHGEPSGAGQRLVAWQLGRVHRWPRAVKCLLPFVMTCLAWAGVMWLVSRWQADPPAESAGRLWAQSAGVGVVVYLAWAPLVCGVMFLHMLESHVYLGQSPFWEFVTATARALLRPLRALPLRAGPVDLAPLAAAVLALAAGHYGGAWLTGLLRQLAF